MSQQVGQKVTQHSPPGVQEVHQEVRQAVLQLDWVCLKESAEVELVIMFVVGVDNESR